ncbi:MAG: TonB-dependent receptor [Gammaproteobacteria bacterium]
MTLPVVVLLAALDPGATIVVTATRGERPLRDQAGNTAVIAGNDIGLVASTHPSEIFGRAPGAWVTQGSSQEHLTAIRSPVLTGPGACGAFLFLEDGLATRAAGFCNVNGLFELNAEQAQTIEVVRGPGSAFYGSNALHGMFNVVMPRPRDPNRYARVDTGPNAYARLAAGLGDGRRWRVDANAAHDGGWRDAAGYTQFKLNAAVRQDAIDWSFAATGLRQDTAAFILGADAYRDLSAARGNPSPDAFRHAQNQRLSARWTGDAHGWRLSVRPYARHARMRFLQHFAPGEPEEMNGHASGGLQLLARRDGERALWVLGSDIELTRGFVEQVQREPLTDASPFLNATRPAGVHYDFTVRATTAALFAHTEQALAGAYRWTAGARIEYTGYHYDNHAADGNLRDDGTVCPMGGCHYNRPADRTDRFTTFTPKLGLVRPFGASSTAYLSATRGFRAPQVNELYRLQRGQDVADLDVERLDSLELGMRGTVGSTQYDVAAFAMRKRGVVFQDSAGFAVSDGRTRHAGVELMLVQPLGAAFELALNGTLARHTYAFDRTLAGGDTIRSGDDVDTAPRHMGSVRLAWNPREAQRVELEWSRIGAHWLDAANAHSYPGHSLLHLRGSHRVAPALRIGWRVTNLTDRRYAERADFAFGDYRYFPGPPRSVYLTLQVEL